MWDIDLKVNRKFAHPSLTLFWLWVLFSSHNTVISETAGNQTCSTGHTKGLRIKTVDDLKEDLERLLDGTAVNHTKGKRVIIVSEFLWAGQRILSANLENKVNEVGLKLVVESESALLSCYSLALWVKKVNDTNFTGASNDTNFRIFNITNMEVTIPGMFMSKSYLPPLGSVELLPSLTKLRVSGLSPEDQNNASRVIFYQTTSLFQDNALGQQRVISAVLDCSVSNLSITTLNTPPNTTPFHEDQSTFVTTNYPTNLGYLETKNTSQLNASQVGELVGYVEKLLQGPEVTDSDGQRVISVVNNLMGRDPPVLSASANRLIRAVDEVGLKLVFVGESAVISNDVLALAVRKVDGTNFTGVSFSIFNITNLQVTVHGSISTVPRLGSVVLPTSLTEGLSPEDQKLASRVQFTFYQKTLLFRDKAPGNRRPISPILGSSVANISISNLTENIQFTLRHSQPVTGNNEVSCVYWNFSLNGFEGGWSSDGCFLLNTSENETACSCNHLTNFAILLDLSRKGVTQPQQELVLTFITYIGCGISAILLSLTLLTFLFFQNLQKEIPSKILVQFCLSLFLLNMAFLLDGWLAFYRDSSLCTSIAFLLHYFLLTSFTWAGLEALHMYHSIIMVFSHYVRRYMLKFSLVGWGLPLIIVIIVISVDKENYGLVAYGGSTNDTSDAFCWLRNDIAFYVTVVGYFLLVFVLSLIVFIVVLVQLARIKKQNPQNTSPHRSLLSDLRSIAGLVVLLGLTWGFALFAWGPLHLPFIYLFTIFNSLQGFFIFFCFCAVKERVRRQWRTHLCPGRLCLAENSKWSWKASHNSNKTSAALATTSYLSPAS